MVTATLHPPAAVSQPASDATTSPMEEPKSVIIIGAGIGGVTLAARLAHKGFKVTVLEKNDFSGGRCSLIHKDGYRFDQGPSLLLMPKVFQKTFADLGERLEDHLDLVKCDPNYILHFDDGDTMRLSTDLVEMRKEVERVAAGVVRFAGATDAATGTAQAATKKDPKNTTSTPKIFTGPIMSIAQTKNQAKSLNSLLAFLSESHTHYETSLSLILTRHFPTFASFFTIQNLFHALRLHVLESWWGRVERLFEVDKLRRGFSFQSMYMGMSPFEALGTYSLLAYTEMVEGIYYPIGGFHRVVAALENLAVAKGAQFHYSTPVSRITVDDVTKQSTGVLLQDGTHLPADLVISNVDL
ncbi:hypothetical protein HDV05_007940, partial [Chytridiales sp. JEL 0842]